MRILFFLCLLLPFSSFGQLFNPEVEWFEDQNFFNRTFIVENSIKTFRSSFATKEDGEIIDETKSFTLAEFDGKGNLTRMVEGSEWLKKVDSTILTFQYDDDNNLLNKGEFISNLRFQYLHIYDDEKQLEKIMKMDVSRLPTKVVSVKKFNHEVGSDGRLIKYSLNDNGKAYIKESLEMDKGNLVMKKMEYLVNSNFEKYEFNYIDGKLRTKSFVSNIGGNIDLESNYYYNEEGELDEVVISNDGIRNRKIAFVYNSKGLPTAMIVRYYDEKKLDIYQFDYTFY